MANNIIEPVRFKSRLIKSSTMVLYRGGGYDGCSWETNLAFIDRWKTYHSIYHSGYRGCDTPEKLRDYYQGWLEQIQKAKPRDRSVDREAFDLYNFRKAAERERFGRQCPIDWLLLAGKWFRDNQPHVDIRCQCDICEKLYDIVSSDMFPTGQHGAGGVAILSRGIACYDCYSTNSCTYCGEYSSDGMTDLGCCSEWCHQEQEKENAR